VVGHDGVALYIAFAPDGKTFVSGGTDGAISLFDGRTGALLATVHPGQAGKDASPVFLHDGHTVLIGSLDNGAYSWDTRPAAWIAFACRVAGRNLTKAEWRSAFGDEPYRATCPTQ
jgi:WD40 repeat protein